MNTAMKEFIKFLENSLDVQNEILNWDIVKQNALNMEKEQFKEMYLKGIENYDITFKRKSQWTSVNKNNKK
jgi:hypothetical protein